MFSELWVCKYVSDIVDKSTVLAFHEHVFLRMKCKSCCVYDSEIIKNVFRDCRAECLEIVRVGTSYSFGKPSIYILQDEVESLQYSTFWRNGLSTFEKLRIIIIMYQLVFCDTV